MEPKDRLDRDRLDQVNYILDMLGAIDSERDGSISPATWFNDAELIAKIRDICVDNDMRVIGDVLFCMIRALCEKEIHG